MIILSQSLGKKKTVTLPIPHLVSISAVTLPTPPMPTITTV